MASILLALTADAWWDGRQDRTREEALLRSLRAEIVLNLELLDEWDGALGQTADRASALLDLASPDAQPIDAARFDALVLEALTFRTYLPSTGSIGAALSQLSLIRSDALRQEIAGSQERLRAFQEHFDWASDEGETIVMHLMDRIPVFTSDNAAWAERDPGPGRRDILRDVMFANLLGGRVYRLGRMTEESVEFRAHLNRIVDLIEEQEIG